MSNQFWSGWRPSQDAPALLLGQAVETQDCYVMSSFPHQAISGSQSDERDPVKVVPNPFHQFKRYLLLLTRPLGSPSPGHHNQNLVLSAAASFWLSATGKAWPSTWNVRTSDPTWVSIGSGNQLGFLLDSLARPPCCLCLVLFSTDQPPPIYLTTLS